MNKIWKKIGKQQNLHKESQQQKRSQNSIRSKENDMERKEYLSSKDGERNKKRFDLSECLSISDDTIKDMKKKKKFTINQKVFECQSNSISLEDEDSEYPTQRQQSQFTQFSKDLEEQINFQRNVVQTDDSPFYDFATFSDLSKCSESRFKGQKQKFVEYGQVDSFFKNKLNKKKKQQKLTIEGEDEQKNDQIGGFQPILTNLRSQKDSIPNNNQCEVNQEKQINNESSQIFQEQQIQEVIDVQSDQFIKTLNHYKFPNSILNKENSQGQISGSRELQQKLKENQDLKCRINSLSLEIQNLKDIIRQKETKEARLKLQKTSIGLQTDQKEDLGQLTSCFQRQKGGEINQKYRDLENLNSFQRLMEVNSDGDNSDFLNISIQLNLSKNKRIVIKNRQSFQQLQQYIFDLEQKITFDRLQFEEKTKKVEYFTELKMKQKYSVQIRQIKRQLEITKAKYDKLKLQVKRYQKERIKRQNEELEKQKQPKSNFDEMIKNVSEFHRLLTLFNQFNQSQYTYINEPHATLNSPKNNSGKKQYEEFYNTKQLYEEQIQMKNHEQNFEQVRKEIQSQWDMIENIKIKCLNSQSRKQIELNSKKLPQKKILRSPDLKKRLFDQFDNQKEQGFQTKNIKEDSRSQKRFPLSEKQKLLRYQSPQNDRRFCSQFDAKQRLNQGNFKKSRSPQYDYETFKRKKQKQSPQNRQNHNLRQSKTPEDKKNLYQISLKLSELQKDIKTELKSING